MDQRYDENYAVMKGVSDTIADEDKLDIRHPSSSYFAWRKGVRSENIDQTRPIKIHASVSDTVLEKIEDIVHNVWGLPEIHVERLYDRTKFVDDCRLPYRNNKYTFARARRDIDTGVLIPLFDTYLCHPQALFSNEEAQEVMMRHRKDTRNWKMSF